MASDAPTGGGAPGGGAPAPSTAAPAAPAANAPAPPSGQQTESGAANSSAPSSPSQASAAPPRRTIKLKDGDKVEEVDHDRYVDLLREAYGDDGLANVGQLARLARQKVSQTGAQEKELRAALEDLRAGRAHAVLSKIHGDPAKARAILEEELGRLIVESQQPKEKREQSELERRNKQLREENEKYESAARERRLVTEAAQAQAFFDKQYRAALANVGVSAEDLKANPILLAEINALVQAEFDPETTTRESFQLLLRESAAAVLKRHGGLRDAATKAERERVLAMKAADLIAFLGEDKMRELRAAEAAAVRSRQANGQFAAKTPVTNGETPKAPKGPTSIDDWLKDRF